MENLVKLSFNYGKYKNNQVLEKLEYSGYFTEKAENFFENFAHILGNVRYFTKFGNLKGNKRNFGKVFGTISKIFFSYFFKLSENL